MRTVPNPQGGLSRARAARTCDQAAESGSMRAKCSTAGSSRNPLGCRLAHEGAEVSWREHGAVPAVTSTGRAEDARW
jgi:hypothetical protein